MRYWAGAREIAGTAEQWEPAASLAELLVAIRAKHGDRMTRLIETGLVLVDGERVSIATERALAESTLVEILPPFAGG